MSDVQASVALEIHEGTNSYLTLRNRSSYARARQHIHSNALIINPTHQRMV